MLRLVWLRRVGSNDLENMKSESGMTQAANWMRLSHTHRPRLFVTMFPLTGQSHTSCTLASLVSEAVPKSTTTTHFVTSSTIIVQHASPTSQSFNSFDKFKLRHQNSQSDPGLNNAGSGSSNSSSFDDSGCGTSVGASSSDDNQAGGSRGDSATPPATQQAHFFTDLGSESASMTRMPQLATNQQQPDAYKTNNGNHDSGANHNYSKINGKSENIYGETDENSNGHHTTQLEPTDVDESAKRRMSICANCSQPILDRYILRVQPNMEFHPDCLVCSECNRPLDENCTAFVRSGKTYCKEDYCKLFGRRCARCQMQFDRSDMVMRARGLVFHLNCFNCVTCERRLVPGEQFMMRSEELFCRPECLRIANSSPNTMRSMFFPGSDQSILQNLRGQWPPPPITQPLLGCIPHPTPQTLNFGLVGQPPPSNAQLNINANGVPTMMDTSVSPNLDSMRQHEFAFGADPANNLYSTNALGAFSQAWTHSQPNGPDISTGPALDSTGGQPDPNGQIAGGFGCIQSTGSTRRQHSSMSSSEGAGLNSPCGDFSDGNPDSVAAPSSTNSGCCALTSGAGSGAGTGGAGGGSAASSTTTASNSTKKNKKDKPTQRVRTVLNETQLKILKQMYNNNQRPDTIVKDHLVEMTGLSARVIRVWFQNKRCKDKKRQNALKEMQQHQEKEQALHGVRLNGIGPLVASSPTSLDTIGPSSSSNQSGGTMANNASIQLNPIDIRQFSQNPALWDMMDPSAIASASAGLPPQIPPPYSMQHQTQMMSFPGVTQDCAAQQAYTGAINYAPSGPHLMLQQPYITPNQQTSPLADI
ncbi:LIM domain-containing protein [Ditylenchus destructor]|nr:LIM domain-containing protein [Ditylenchus destructor]